MTNWQSVALENIANELRNIREILEKQQSIEVSDEQLSKLQSRENSVENTTASEDFTSISRANSKLEVSEDCISRAEVLDEFKKDYDDVFDLMTAIEEFPSVVPSRAEGEWVEVVKRTEQYDREGVKSWAVIYQCPYCGFVLNAIENHTEQYNYCPNCGAKMRLE